jgi:hypothetical protein
MENISRGPTFGDFVTIRTEVSMQDITVADYRVQEYRLPSPPPPLNVMYCASVSVDSQKNTLGTTLRRRESWVISVYL